MTWLLIILSLCVSYVHGDGHRIAPLLGAGFPNFAALRDQVQHETNVYKYLAETSSAAVREVGIDPVWSSLRYRVSLTGLNVSAQCRIDLNETFHGLLRKENFAEKMADAAGKPPSGVLEGNLAWLGSYDECRAITAVTNHTSFTGQYCLGKVETSIPGAQGVSVYYGVCLPSSCNNEDASTLLQKIFPVKLTATCTTPQALTTGDYVAIVVCVVLGMLVLIGTALDAARLYTGDVSREKLDAKWPYGSTNAADVHRHNGEVDERSGLLTGSQDSGINQLAVKVTEPTPTMIERIFLCFSVISNGRKLFNTPTSSGQLTALNGIRVLSMWWVIQGHTFGFSTIFLDNLASLPEVTGRFTFQAISNATFSVDSFFFLSGLLVAYLTLNALRQNQGKISWAMFVFHRFWRLTPALAFCLMIVSTLFLRIADGPFCRTLFQTDMVKACQTHWWPNLLYINNFYPSYGDVAEQCMGWTWYLANDMQFYLISPFLLYPLYRWRWIGIGAVTSLTVACLIVTSVIARVYQMCAIGCPITHHTGDLYAHHDIMYNKPFTRIAPYLVGMLTGYLLSVTKCRLKMNKYLVLLGWGIAAAINLCVLYGLYGLYHGEVFSPDINALYIGTSRFAWSVGLAWVALACATGNGGPINDILSWRVWAPLGRLTYCAYLVHPMVLYVYYLSKRKLIHYTDLELSTIFVGNLSLSYAVAFLVSMLVEAPMIGLEKLVFTKK